jgi:hypothetical protein
MDGDPHGPHADGDAERHVPGADCQREGADDAALLRVDLPEGAPCRIDDPDVPLAGSDEVGPETEIDCVGDLV